MKYSKPEIIVQKVTSTENVMFTDKTPCEDVTIVDKFSIYQMSVRSDNSITCVFTKGES